MRREPYHPNLQPYLQESPWARLRTSLLFLMVLMTVVSCKDAEPRWPVEVKGGSFLKLSAERNRKLLEEEVKLLEQMIQADSLHEYLSSASGSRYYYESRMPGDGYRPKTDDLVTLQYNLLNWSGDTIYSRDEIGVLKYKVDKQELFPGLRSSVKLLQKEESAVFWFPSSLAFGYHGDQERIGPNIPVRSQVWILDIEKSQDTIKPNS